MSNVTNCLDSLSMIDDSIFLAECNVIKAYNNILFKTDKMMRYTENDNDTKIYIEAYIQEDGGRPLGEYLGMIAVLSGYGLLLFIKNLFRMIQNMFKYIINKISDLLLKMKINSYEYVQSPLSVEDIKSDVEKITKSVQDATDSLKMYRSYKYDKAKLHELLKQIETDLKSMKIFGVNDNSKKYKITPKEFVECRGLFRHYADVAKTNKKYVDEQYENIIKLLEIDAKTPDNELSRSDIKGRVLHEDHKDFLETDQRVWSIIAEASARFLSSFRFSTATKA